MTTSYAEASAHIAAVDHDWARLVRAVGPCLHAPKPAREPFEALVRAVAYQQLHARAAEAILSRLLGLAEKVDASAFPSPRALLDLDVAELRACGFSGRKATTLHALADAALRGIVPRREEADTMTDAELIARLTPLPGIGIWTVEMMLIYTLDRRDVLPADDFGIREGYRRLKSLGAAPTRAAMVRAAEPLRPYRTVASWYLWRVPKDVAPASPQPRRS